MNEFLATLADGLEKRFTPFAFTCDCNGTGADCAATLRDEVTQIRYYAMLDVVNYIRSLEV